MCVLSSHAQGQTYDANMVQRMNQLEAETQALRAELKRFQEQQPMRLPETNSAGVPAMPVSDSASASTSNYLEDSPPLPTEASSAPYAPNTQGEPQYFTLDQLKGEMKKLVWKKGDFTITPYGYLWGNMVYETERSTVGDYTLYVNSPQENGQGQPTFHVDARNTRLGFDVLGPRLACLNCAQTGGKVEIDFQNNLINPNTENRGTVLLRHAYFEAKDDQFRLVAGQTWDVISPLNPNSIMYSVYWDAGNIGYRRAQFRGERYFALSDTVLLTMQGSVNGNIVADTIPAGVVGDQSSWPTIEGRAALTLGERGKGCLPITVGVSSHIGEQEFSFANAQQLPARTWSLNADWKVPMNEYWGFQGECFVGENLSQFLGGIGQGYDFTLRRSIYSQGGWIEGYYYWTDKFHSHIGYTLDDPLDSDITPAAGRTYNQVIWGNVIYDVTKQFQLGLEVGSWRTLFQAETPADSIRTELMVRYGF
jgi:hypothetical protein